MTLPRLSRLTLRGLREAPGRAVLTATGVALGVALFVGATIANATVATAFTSLLDATVGRADVVVQSTGSDGPQADTVERVRRLPGVERAQGVALEPGVARIRIDEGTPAARRLRPMPGNTLHFPAFVDVTVSVTGLDRGQSGPVFDYPLQSGRLPADGELAVALAPAIAAQLDARVGTVIRLTGLDGQSTTPLLVSGILTAGAGPGAPQAVAPLAVTARLAGRSTPPSEVHVVLAPHVDSQRWTVEHQRELGPGLQVQDRGSVLRPFRSSVQAPLGAISGVALLALLIGMYLIHLTLSTTVVERTRRYGAMRAIGATRAQVRRTVLIEAAAVGVVGSAAGLLLGIAVGTVMVRVVAGAVHLHLSGITVTPGTLVVGAVAGLVTTLIAALLPARRAARVPVVEALHGLPLDDRRATRAPAIGAALVGTGIAVTLLARTHAPFDGLASLLLLGGAVLAVPVLLGPLMRVLVAMAGRVSPAVWRVAVRQSGRERSRSATTLGLVMVVFALVLAVDSGVASVNNALQSELRRQFGADVRLTSSQFDAATTAAVAATPGVVSLTAILRAPVRPYLADHPSETIELEAIDPATYFAKGGFAWTQGNDRRARAALAGGGAVILPDGLAHRLGARIGSTVRLATADGPKPFTVAGRYVSMINQADLVIGAADAGRFGVKTQRELDVYTEPGRAVAVGDTVESRILGTGTITMQMASDLRNGVGRTLTRYSRLYESLLGVALLIGVLGLANTLAMAALERRREIGILRAVGTQRRTVAALFVAESATLTAVAYVLAVPLGALVAANLLAGVGRTAGIPGTYRAPWSAVPVLAVIAVVVALAAAAIPAHRAASTDPIAALRAD